MVVQSRKVLRWRRLRPAVPPPFPIQVQMRRRYVGFILVVGMRLSAKVNSSQDYRSPRTDLESGSARVFVTAPNIEKEFFATVCRPQFNCDIPSGRGVWNRLSAQTMFFHTHQRICRLLSQVKLSHYGEPPSIRTGIVAFAAGIRPMRAPEGKSARARSIAVCKSGAGSSSSMRTKSSSNSDTSMV